MQAVAGRHDGTAPLDAQILATVASPPMSVMLRLMNVPSDDLFAELFAKQLGVRFGDRRHDHVGRARDRADDRVATTGWIRRSSTAPGSGARTAPRPSRSCSC